jgi:hypothetical protein
MPQGLDHEMIQNAILYAGQPEMQEMEVETVTTFGPGRLVIANTYNYTAQVAGATSSVVLGVADVPSDQKLTAYYTPTAGGALTKTFTAKDQIRVLRGDIVVKLVAKSGETIVVGTRLISAAAGMVAAGTTAGQVVGYSLEDATTRISACCDWILVKMVI